MKLVELIWIDSYATRGWQTEFKGELFPIHSIGYIVDESKDIICISTSIGGANTVMDPLTIPKVAILKRRNISLKKGDKLPTKKPTKKVSKKSTKKST